MKKRVIVAAEQRSLSGGSKLIEQTLRAGLYDQRFH